MLIKQGTRFGKRDTKRSITIALLQAGTNHSENGNPGLETNFRLFAGPVCTSDGTTDDAVWPHKPWMDLAINHTCTSSTERHDLRAWYVAVATNTRAPGQEFLEPMSRFLQALPFWKMESNHTALRIKNRDLVTTVLAYVCVSHTETKIVNSTAGLRLPDGQYRITFLAPADLSVVGNRMHVSAGLREERLIELPPFSDDLIKLERIRTDERTLIPGTQ